MTRRGFFGSLLGLLGISVVPVSVIAAGAGVRPAVAERWLVDASAFDNITGDILYKKMLEHYQDESCFFASCGAGASKAS